MWSERPAAELKAAAMKRLCYQWSMIDEISPSEGDKTRWKEMDIEFYWQKDADAGSGKQKWSLLWCVWTTAASQMFYLLPSLPMCSQLIWESTQLVLRVIREDCCVNHCVSAILSSPCPHPVFVLYLISSTGKIILESRVKGTSQVCCNDALCEWKTSSLLSMFILCFVL